VISPYHSEPQLHGPAMKNILNVVLVGCLAITCDAGEEVIQCAKTRDVRTLSGTVTDTTGAEMPNVQVCSMANHWKKELRCTATDSGGKWSLPSTAKEDTYELRFVKEGFNQVWIRVRLAQRKVAPFVLKLPVAT
ncbi:MAG TPA: carboxypeptidase-like regulatory domain-containing protein, partial [Terriglobales bacterium]|nr:carboxypeptidase-like regulatory domain-containing protein [Terriglobales bacterium]